MRSTQPTELAYLLMVLLIIENCLCGERDARTETTQRTGSLSQVYPEAYFHKMEWNTSFVLYSFNCSSLLNLNHRVS